MSFIFDGFSSERFLDYLTEYRNRIIISDELDSRQKIIISSVLSNISRIQQNIIHLNVVFVERTRKIPYSNEFDELIYNLKKLYEVLEHSVNSDIPSNLNGENLSFVIEKVSFLLEEYVNKVRQLKNRSTRDIEKYQQEAKELVSSILSEREKLLSQIDKANEVNDNLTKLEQRQRKVLSTITIGEDEYKNKISLIEAASERVNIFIETLKDYETKHKDIANHLTTLDYKIVTTLDKVSDLETLLSEKQTRLDNVLLQAEEVLGKASTAALGQYFKEQYDHSKKHLWIWPTTSLLFLIGAIVLCIATVFPSLLSPSTGNINEVSFIISRLVISPLFLVGAWFCATQYVKRKNIIEDYAYKKVLSLSLLSFKSEIEKTGEQNTTEFIRAVQNEIIKSPLESLDRKHHKKESEFLKSMQFEVMNGMLNNAKNILNVGNEKVGSERQHDKK